MPASTTGSGSAATAGLVDGTGTGAEFSNPSGIAIDSSGNLYVADTNNNVIRKIASGGVVTTLAGNNPGTGAAGASGSTNGTGVNTTGTGVLFNAPTAVAVGTDGYVYVADNGQPRHSQDHLGGRRHDARGRRQRPRRRDRQQCDLRHRRWHRGRFAPNNIYVSDTSNNTIRMITPAGVVTTLLSAFGAWLTCG